MEKSSLIDKVFNRKGNMDFSIFFTVMFFAAFGVIMVNSSSFNIMFDKQRNVIPLFQQVWTRQLLYGGVGLIMMILFSYVQTKFATYVAIGFYPVVLFLLILVTLTGDETRGAARAFNLKVFTFQPSEFAKITLILFLAWLIDRYRNKLHKKMLLAYLLLAAALPVILVGLEDFSTAAVILAIGGAMIFISYRHLMHIFFSAGIGLGMITLLYNLKKARSVRFDIYNSPWDKANEGGRQTVQSLYAIGSGGFFGRGLGQSLQKMGMVTQAHHDIIFAIICEELGMFGGGLILLIYLGLLYQLLLTAISAAELRDFLIVIGVMAQIAAQVIVNVGVATNTLPNTGMPLPFISYGGSSIIVLSLEMALVLSISRKNQFQSIKELEAQQQA